MPFSVIQLVIDAKIRADKPIFLGLSEFSLFFSFSIFLVLGTIVL